MASLPEPAAVTIHSYKTKVEFVAFVEQNRTKNVNLKEFLLSIPLMFRKCMFSKLPYHRK